MLKVAIQEWWPGAALHAFLSSLHVYKGYDGEGCIHTTSMRHHAQSHAGLAGPDWRAQQAYELTVSHCMRGCTSPALTGTEDTVIVIAADSSSK